MPLMVSANKLFCKIIEGGRPTLDEFLQSFCHIFELIQQLHSTPQDKEWHAEGDVFKHTQRVLDCCYDIIETEACHLTNDQKLALILGVVLHDIGKPLTTKEVEINSVSRIVAPNHEARGASYLAYRILDLDIPYNIVLSVLSLVNYHHMPKLLVIKNATKANYYRLTRLANVELLYYIAKADMLGRQCEDQEGQLDLIRLFRIYCEEYEIWGKINPYEEWRVFFEHELRNYSSDCRDFIYGNAIRDFEAGFIFTPHEAVARHYSYLDSFPQLVILMGPSGSGKSSWIQKYLKDYLIISLDKLREEFGKNQGDQSKNPEVLLKAKQELKYHLAHHKKVVWDATNLRKDFRSMLIGLGMDYHALVTIVVFHQKIAEVLLGNKQRTESIPIGVIHDQINRLEWVELSEAHRILFVNRKDNLHFVGGCSPRLSPFEDSPIL